MNNSDKLRDHLQKFYSNNPDFGEEGGVDKKWAWLDFGFIKIPFPNIKSRSDIIYIHDVNHIVNDYDTTWKGEVSVSAWEVSSRLGKYLTGWCFALLAMGIGVLAYPKHVYVAFIRGQMTRSVFTMNISKNAMMNMTLEDLKNKTGHDKLYDIDISGDMRGKIKFFLFALISVLFVVSPFAFGVFILAWTIGII